MSESIKPANPDEGFYEVLSGVDGWGEGRWYMQGNLFIDANSGDVVPVRHVGRAWRSSAKYRRWAEMQ